MSNFVLSFDGFGQDSLTAEAGLAGAAVAEVVRLAVRHYLEQLDSGRFCLRVPAFARSAHKRPALQVDLNLDQNEFAALASEADRQGLDVEELLGHAALFYLADRDAGRVALGA